MKHKLFLRRFFASLLLLAVSTLTWAYDFEVDGIYYDASGSNAFVTYRIFNDKCYSGAITIPSTVTYNGVKYNVAYIKPSAFYNCTGLTSVAISSGVTKIHASAFSGCSGLTSIIIPESVTSIDKSAFSDCSNLTSVTINSNDIVSKEYTSSSCLNNIFGKQVQKYVIGEGVTTIGNYAFSGCSSLTSITIPESVTKIGSSAFKGCKSLMRAEFASIESLCKISFGHNPLNYAGHLYINGVEVKDLVIPNSVTTIGQFTFSGCTGLTSVTIPNSVTSIDKTAFSDCSNLTSVTINSNVVSKTYTSSSSINNIFGKQVQKYIIGDGVTSIGQYAFYGCTGLMSVTIPNSVTVIGQSAFYGCSTLTSATIPNSVTSIGIDAFYNCSHLIIQTSEQIYDRYKNYIKGCKAVLNVKDGQVLFAAFKGNGNILTWYDDDGDGIMEPLYRREPTYKNYSYDFLDLTGAVKKNVYAGKIYDDYATRINSNDWLFYDYSTSWQTPRMFSDVVTGTDISKTIGIASVADVDNDGRKDIIPYISLSSTSSFPIYFQQPDGTFLSVEQSVTKDAAEVEAATKRKGTATGGVVSFAVGMMVKAREVICNGEDESFEARSIIGEKTQARVAVNSDNTLRTIDMNNDGVGDILSASGSDLLYSYDDNKWFYNSKKGGLFPCDLNGDSELDYICYDGSTITLQTRTEGNNFNEKALFSNARVKNIVYRDFNNDGQLDILAYINDGSSTYFVFFRNDGDLSFTRIERNFTINYTLKEISDIDGDGLYELLVRDETNNKTKLLKINSVFNVNVFKTAEIDLLGDFDGDGKMNYLCEGEDFSEIRILSTVENSSPKKMLAPTAVLDAESQRLRINWTLGEDKETSACDLTYELRIGTQPGSGDVLFGAALADGKRRTLDEGNMGRSLSTLFNAKSMKPGKYYISVQAVDGGGRGGAWSDDFVYDYQLTAPVIVSNINQQMTAGDTLLLRVKAPIEGAEYKWTVSNGRQIESEGNETRFIFERDGKQSVNLAMTYDGKTLNAEPLDLEVTPARRVSSNSLGYVDFNQDGYPEYLGYVNDGNGNLKKVLLSYATQYSGSGSGRILDFNMDGYPDVVYSSSNVLINLGEQNNDFDVTTETVNLNNTTYGANTWFDANNDGKLDNTSGYNDGTNLAWSKYATGSPNYDVNRDGMLDIITKNGNKFYVSYKEPTASMDYTSPQLMYDEAKSYWQLEDINNDGYADIVYYDYNPKKLTIVKGGPTLPYKETIVYDLPVQSSSISIHDYNNDGYLDICIGSSGLMEFGQDFAMEFKILNKSDVPYSGYFMVQEDGGYPCSEGRYESYITNLPPSAPASVAAKQTKDGMLITWSDADDDHTPAMQMRYNVSVKRKGKKGDNSFVISPMNGLIDKATICGNIMYKKSTQMLVPASVLTAGETYEIQVQAIDLWNQHSPMTKAVEFTMTSNGYIDVAEQVATNKETTLKFVGTQAGSYSLNAGDGATIVSNKGNGEFIVKWVTEGVKSITLTAGSTTVKSSVTVVNPMNLAFTVPASVFAKAPLTVEVSDEMAKAAKNVGLRCNDSRVKVDYVTGSKTASVTFPATGTYTLEAYCTDDVKGNTYSQSINVTAEMPKAVIKQVDVDGTTGSYAINWNAGALPAGISKVIVSKEGSKLGEFSEIGTVDAASGVYVDKSSNASVMASRYSIRLLANNGQESNESVAHRPLHVMIVKGIAGFNLIWDEYEGLDVQSYDIMRGSTPGNLQKIAQVAGSINSYSDLTAPSGVSYYAINLNTVPSQKADSGLLYANANEPVGSNVISTANALDVVPANSVEIIVLDEDNTLSDEHRDLQLYHMILPTYTTVSKVAWEITEGSEMATINANGLLHAIGGNGTVVATVRTLDGSDLSAQISISINASKETGIREVTVDAQDETVTLTEVRYYTLDGHRLDAPVAGKVCLEWSIYSNGQIKTRKILK